VANRTQVSLRVSTEAVAKLDRFAAASGSTRATLMRFLIEDFAVIADDLTSLVQSARRGSEAEAVGDWVQQIVGRLSDDATQLALPTTGRRSGSSVL
jgi:predicted DNA-binding protein